MIIPAFFVIFLDPSPMLHEEKQKLNEFKKKEKLKKMEKYQKPLEIEYNENNACKKFLENCMHYCLSNQQNVLPHTMEH